MRAQKDACREGGVQCGRADVSYKPTSPNKMFCSAPPPDPDPCVHFCINASPHLFHLLLLLHLDACIMWSWLAGCSFPLLLQVPLDAPIDLNVLHQLHNETLCFFSLPPTRRTSTVSHSARCKSLICILISGPASKRDEEGERNIFLKNASDAANLVQSAGELLVLLMQISKDSEPDEPVDLDDRQKHQSEPFSKKGNQDFRATLAREDPCSE